MKQCALRTAGIAALACAIGCATGGVGGREAIARLEQERSANPRSEPVLRALGIAYYRSGKLPEARAALARAVTLDARDGTAALYLGLTAEGQNDIPAARAAYATYIQYGRTSRVRHALENRLAALQRKQLAAAAKTAVAQEQQLAQVSGAPNVVAVLPLSFSGADSSLEPLERGFAELLTIDLARSSRLTVVERVRLQAVLDELKLQGSGATDSSTNVRAGRILQAGRLVQGAIVQGTDALRVDALVIDVPTTRVAGTANDAQTLDQLLTLEKNIALALFQQLGVTLSTAERNAIEQRPTRSLAAFLAYSRGLLLEDEGQFDGAETFFDNATRLDPNFGAAQAKSREARQIAAGSLLTTSAIEGTLAGSPEGRVVAQAVGGVAVASAENGTALALAGDLNPTLAGAAALSASGALTAPPIRDPIALGTGLDNPGQRTAHIEIVVKIP